jgi:hypothetical protein
MGTVRRTMVVLTAVAALLLTATAADAATIAKASARLGGLTGGELLGQATQQFYQLPLSQNPVNGGGVNTCVPIAGGKVLWIWTQPGDASNPTVCTVKPGTPVFNWVWAASCNSIPSPAYITREEQVQCVLAYLADSTPASVTMTIDSDAPVQLIDSDYFALSPQVGFVLPPHNIFDVKPQPGTFSAGGYLALIRPLTPGTHSLFVDLGGGVTQVATVKVVPGYKG